MAGRAQGQGTGNVGSHERWCPEQGAARTALRCWGTAGQLAQPYRPWPPDPLDPPIPDACRGMARRRCT